MPPKSYLPSSAIRLVRSRWCNIKAAIETQAYLKAGKKGERGRGQSSQLTSLCCWSEMEAEARRIISSPTPRRAVGSVRFRPASRRIKARSKTSSTAVTRRTSSTATLITKRSSSSARCVRRWPVAAPSRALARQPDGTMLLTVAADAGQDYRVQASPDLAAWTTVFTSTDSGGTFDFTTAARAPIPAASTGPPRHEVPPAFAFESSFSLPKWGFGSALAGATSLRGNGLESRYEFRLRASSSPPPRKELAPHKRVRKAPTLGARKKCAPQSFVLAKRWSPTIFDYSPRPGKISA